MNPDFVKLHAGFWRGSMREEEPYTRLLFLALLSLADENGFVHGTPGFFAAFAAIPEEAVERGLKRLQESDPSSTSPDCNGARIERLADSPNRYRIVNYARYHRSDPAEDRKAYKAAWMRARRAEAPEAKRVSEPKPVEKAPSSDGLKTLVDSCGHAWAAVDTCGQAWTSVDTRGQPGSPPLESPPPNLGENIILPPTSMSPPLLQPKRKQPKQPISIGKLQKLRDDILDRAATEIPAFAECRKTPAAIAALEAVLNDFAYIGTRQLRSCTNAALDWAAANAAENRRGNLAKFLRDWLTRENPNDEAKRQEAVLAAAEIMRFAQDQSERSERLKVVLNTKTGEPEAVAENRSSKRGNRLSSLAKRILEEFGGESVLQREYQASKHAVLRAQLERLGLALLYRTTARNETSEIDRDPAEEDQDSGFPNAKKDSEQSACDGPKPIFPTLGVSES